MTDEDRALLELGRWLAAHDYRFVTPTPASHAVVHARAASAEATTVEGALGWSRPFRAGALPELEARLAAAGCLQRDASWCRSTVRFSTVAPEAEPAAASLAASPPDPEAARHGLFVHSAYPTLDAASVFFGPDTYRFIALLRRSLRPAGRVVDIGAGSGAGALSVLDRAHHVVLADINPHALRLARINAALAGVAAEVVHSDVLAGVAGPIDAVISNPPYLADAAARVYRDGGGALGIDLSVRIVRESLARLSPGGQLVLYTGSPVLAGRHPLRDALAPLVAPYRALWSELDPDVFGEELAVPPYDTVDRIAVIALVIDV